MPLDLDDLRILRDVEKGIIDGQRGEGHSSPYLVEADLVIPALVLIQKYPGITTTELIERLMGIINLSARELSPLPSRPSPEDCRFGQMVRNLRSHRSLERYEYALYRDGRWYITLLGNWLINKIKSKVPILLWAKPNLEKD